MLVTGGAGYLGSHACVALLEAGHEVVVVDNFTNSTPAVIDRIHRVSGHAVTVLEMDVRDARELASGMRASRVDAVLHFAALKSISESLEDPSGYLHNNVGGTASVLEAMQEAGVRRLVFSSSATVYGQPDHVPVGEDAPLRPGNPYAVSKQASEDLIRSVGAHVAGFGYCCLRYFNPAGAHPSGLLGESPTGLPNNLFPFVAQVAAGKRANVAVYGGDYPTRDGTGVRDYIHVSDLAEAHVAALHDLSVSAGARVFNLGSGRGASVLEVIRAFGRACGRDIPFEIVARRPGDLAELLADASLARQALGWQATRGLDEICRDAWRWEQRCGQVD